MGKCWMRKVCQHLMGFPYLTLSCFHLVWLSDSGLYLRESHWGTLMGGEVLSEEGVPLPGGLFLPDTSLLPLGMAV